MMVTTVRTECPECKQEVDAKIMDCDSCYEEYLDRGGKPENWDDLFCEHLQCTVCEADLS